MIVEQNVLIESLATISQGVVVTDLEQRIIYSNKAFSDITGYSRQEFIGRNCKFLQGDKTDPATTAAIRMAIDAGQEFSAEILNYTKAGETFWNDLIVTPVRDASGKLIRFIGISRDITARKAAEASLVAMEQNHRFLLDRVQAAVVVHKATTEILFANVLASELLGIDQDKMPGAADTDRRWDFFREDGTLLPISEYPVNRALSTKSVVQSHVLGVRRPSDQKLLWLMCSAYPILDSFHQTTQVVVSFTDVTSLKQAERSFQKSEERLRLVLRGANDAAWDWDLLSQDLYYSPRWWQMVGHAPNAMPSSIAVWKRFVHPRDLSQAIKVLDRALKSSANSYEVEFRLRHADGHYVPVLSRAFILRDQSGKPIRVSGTNTDLTERKLAESQINKLAYYDPLTDLPNRRSMTERLRKSLKTSARSRQHGALLFIDLDNFKILNDTRGHDAGDVLLQQAAQRLRRCVRDSESVGRMGGDEFVLVLENLGYGVDEAGMKTKGIAQKIRDALAFPYTIDGSEYRCTPSIGITLFKGANTSFKNVMKQADLAMYQAKAAGRNTVRFFDATMQRAADERHALESDLRSALSAGQMDVHYQPQIDSTGAMVGAEVLLRWDHPVRGSVPPGIFIPIAEASGLIIDLGNWVLTSACRQLSIWAADSMASRLTLSVNVSIRQFKEPDFVDQVLSILAATGANPARLKLEVTETLLAENIEDVMIKMGRLRETGIAFALDDFGTGYSSLAYLQRLPLDEIKIDRSFVQDVTQNENAATIVRIIISLCQTLGFSVIAEGVETEAQRRFLAEHGCHKYQGFIFGKPVPGNVFLALMTQKRFSTLLCTAVAHRKSLSNSETPVLQRASNHKRW